MENIRFYLCTYATLSSAEPSQVAALLLCPIIFGELARQPREACFTLNSIRDKLEAGVDGLERA